MRRVEAKRESCERSEARVRRERRVECGTGPADGERGWGRVLLILTL